jgi:hypothetical protein
MKHYDSIDLNEVFERTGLKLSRKEIRWILEHLLLDDKSKIVLKRIFPDVHEFIRYHPREKIRGLSQYVPDPIVFNRERLATIYCDRFTGYGRTADWSFTAGNSLDIGEAYRGNCGNSYVTPFLARVTFKEAPSLFVSVSCHYRIDEVGTKRYYFCATDEDLKKMFRNVKPDNGT